MSEDDAFDLMVYVLYDCRLREQYKPDMEALQVSVHTRLSGPEMSLPYPTIIFPNSCKCTSLFAFSTIGIAFFTITWSDMKSTRLSMRLPVFSLFSPHNSALPLSPVFSVIAH